jgi:hypothetical protein
MFLPGGMMTRLKMKGKFSTGFTLIHTPQGSFHGPLKATTV